jgi:hypothetical protein
MRHLKSRPHLLLVLPLLGLLLLAAGPPVLPADEADTLQALLDGAQATVRLEPRTYRLSRTLTITRTLRLEGEGMATTLQFPPNTLGIQVVRKPDGTGDRTVIRSLVLRGGGGTDRGAHGIVLAAGRSSLEDLRVESFAGNGVEIPAANLWHLSRVWSRYHGGDGVHLAGSDVNVGVAVQLDLVANQGWGVREEKGPTGNPLGSVYLGCHAAENRQGAYSIGGTSSCSTLVGCYSESGQKPSRIGQRVLSVGGTHGAGWDTSGFPGSHIGADWLGLRLPRTQEVPLYGGPVLRAGSLPGATGIRGDVMLNQYPSSGQPAGWSCVESASEGKPARWKAWGKLE